MLKEGILTALLFFLMTIYGQKLPTEPSLNNDIISNFKHLSPQQLLDTADYYHNKNSIDTALVCYSLLINTSVKDTDIEQQKRIIEALNKTANIYYYLCDYRTAYELYIKALILCEKANYEPYKLRIYNNIGNIYSTFNKYDMAKLYYSNALHLCRDSVGMVILLNNLGAAELESGKIDSAFYYLKESLNISKKLNDKHSGILNNMALLYEKKQRYDSAFYYYQLSLNEAKKNGNIEDEAGTLANLGALFFEINKTDSAQYYIGLSNAIAEQNNFLRTLSANYLTLSKIEKSKGHSKNALEFFEKYANLKDSAFNVSKFGEINQLQRLYEISKTDQQIEQLVVEKQIKEHTAYLLRIILFITLFVLLLVSVVLLIIFLQKRALNTAYKALFEKNLEIVDLKETSSKKYSEKYKKNTLVSDAQKELLDKILVIMEDIPTICDPKFSLDKLAVLAETNNSYVSQVINNVLKKNFRSFLNDYRIREAQRIFSTPDDAKYTIEAVALRVGFKSRSAFRDAFKEITGVSPNLYLKLLQEQAKD
ncbi:MAG: tetratricopeptide repeat protein [Bacteroidetes bacterium]|nr:tetratricopeptide repeat protein [Bacteroidota bacterium]MCL2302838.1 tetratricopeptide repeat protein [Lentimicrobiaceae bacterium]